MREEVCETPCGKQRWAGRWSQAGPLCVRVPHHPPPLTPPTFLRHLWTCHRVRERAQPPCKVHGAVGEGYWVLQSSKVAGREHPAQGQGAQVQARTSPECGNGCKTFSREMQGVGLCKRLLPIQCEGMTTPLQVGARTPSTPICCPLSVPLRWP